METNSKNAQTRRVVYLGCLRVGDYFWLQGKRWCIYGQLGDTSYCNCGDEKVFEFNDATRVEVD